MLGSCEEVKEDVMTEANGAEVLGETVPRPSMILVCASRNCSFMGSFCSDEISHKLILFGRGTIQKFLGSCDGQDLHRIQVSLLLV